LPNIVIHKLGRTGLAVTNIALGTSPLGSSPNLYGYAVDEERALDTIRAFFSGPLNFADTSNNYGQGRSERAIGKVIRELGGIPVGKVLATKVDADSETRDFSGDRVRRSAEESLERLGIERFQLLHLHDHDLHMDFATGSRKGGAVDALVALKQQGIAQSIGIATGNLQALTDYLNTDVFDVLLSHNKYTLLDRSAEVATFSVSLTSSRRRVDGRKPTGLIRYRSPPTGMGRAQGSWFASLTSFGRVTAAVAATSPTASPQVRG